MKFKPLFNYLVVEPDSDTTVSKGGIIIPSPAQKAFRRNYGTVLAAGPGAPNTQGSITPMTVASGQRILFAQGTATEIEYPLANGNGAKKRILLVRESDCIAVCEPENENETPETIPSPKK